MESNIPPSGPPPLIQPPPSRPAPRGQRGWRIAALILACLLAASLFGNVRHALIGFLATPAGSHHAAGPKLEEMVLESNRSRNKIAVIPVEGVISAEMLGHDGYSMVDYIQDQFDLAAEDDAVKAVVLKVDSPGGEVLASDEIHNTIAKFQEDSGKPVIAAMGGLAASGGYYVSAPCQWIVANELTITGSIGVILQTYNYRGLMDKVGLRPETFKSGKFKDMLSGSKLPEETSPEERAMIQSLVNETFQKFKGVVAKGREQASRKNQGSPEASGRTLAKEWADYADGRILSGKEAYRLGFVDELGSLDQAVARARKLADIENADLINYHQKFDLSNLFRLLGKSESKSIKVELGFDAPKLKAGHLYFLAPALIH